MGCPQWRRRSVWHPSSYRGSRLFVCDSHADLGQEMEAEIPGAGNGELTQRK
jgi:hypothetical protein